MHTKLTLGERLKDLRIERGYTLEELAAQTGLSKAALGKYETNESGDISLFAITKLAGFYDVTTDYLLGLVENKNRSDAVLADLHLSDEAIEMLKSGRINKRLFCELITHPEFPRLMADMEIYVDGMVSMQIRNLNALLESVRTSIVEKYDPKEDNTLRNIEGGAINEDEYFARVVSNDVERILIDFKQQHFKDTSSASAGSPVAAFKESLEEISQVKGGKVEKLMMLFCKQNQINYSKLTDNESTGWWKSARNRTCSKVGPAREENAQRNRTAAAAGFCIPLLSRGQKGWQTGAVCTICQLLFYCFHCRDGSTEPACAVLSFARNNSRKRLFGPDVGASACLYLPALAGMV